MAINRPTFHEAWYRVADLKPRLLSSVKVYRQNFRGQLWYVLENPANNQFSRISSEAYRFIATLDGRRTVTEAWRITNDQLGDSAPTQPEVIGLLGRLYNANLLYAELPPDTQTLFNRYSKRVKREIRSYLTNIFFIKIPLIDPDHFLSRWVNVVGKAFSKIGALLWFIVVTIGLSSLISNWSEFQKQSHDVLAPGNLFWLYISFVLIKLIHELSHSFACRKFGQLNPNGGQVHTLGIMLIVFAPLPYMDASSAWGFREKWHRAIVGAAGVIAELFLAAIAAIIWANTSVGTIHILAYNVIFIAGVSTLIFNGNPLLRFDGYYILSDLIEIPNLAQRSRLYLVYLVKRFCWAIKNLQDPSHTTGERIWFIFYGIASGLYRIYISFRIIIFLNNRLPQELFILVPAFIILAVIAWLVIPIGRFIKYILTDPELARTRQRALVTVTAAFIFLLLTLAIFPFPNHCRIEGIIEPLNMAVIHAGSDGFLTDFVPSNTVVSPDGPPLIKSVNPALRAMEQQLLAEQRGLQSKRNLAATRQPAEMQVADQQLVAVSEKIQQVQLDLSRLNLKSPLAGIFVSPDIENFKGAFIRKGQTIGFVADLDKMLIRTVAPQDVAAILEQAHKTVDIRVNGRPDLFLTGQIEKVFPAGTQNLPSASLGYSVGGDIPTEVHDPCGIKSSEHFFEIHVTPDSYSDVRLLSGQRVIARFSLPSKPLVGQWYMSLRQLFQRRFRF